MGDPIASLRPGARVVVRYRRADPVEGPPLTDVVGKLVSIDAESVVVDARQGAVRVPRRAVVAAKEVPPRPSRRGAPHLAISIEDLQRVMTTSWGALDRESLGDWELRASSGFSQRGNSVAPAGSPGLPLGEAADAVEQWYAARGLPAKLALAGPVGFDPGDDPLGALLLARGYTAGSHTLSLTAAAETVAAADPGGPAVAISGVPTPLWLQSYAGTRTTVPGAVEAVLTGSPRQLFGQVAPGGGLSQQLGLRAPDAAGVIPIALARLGIGAGWGGLGAVWTDPAYRGRGLAGHLAAALAKAAREEGVHLLHLQVEHDNEGAIRLYQGLGFEPHSSYVYLTKLD